jgi:RimJ/RimL family protein N-acetyltransferase
VILETERLLLRHWREADLLPWAAINADPRVRRYLGPTLTFAQAAAWALSYEDDLKRYGFGYWALELRATGAFIGFTGLHRVDDSCLTPGSNWPGGWPGRRGASATPPRRPGPRRATGSTFSACRSWWRSPWCRTCVPRR